MPSRSTMTIADDVRVIHGCVVSLFTCIIIIWLHETWLHYMHVVETFIYIQIYINIYWLNVFKNPSKSDVLAFI